MMRDGESALTVVVGKRVFVFHVDERDTPRSLGISVSVDGVSLWSSEEPGWRDLAVGVEGGSVYWWSARRLIALETSEPVDVLVIDADEDIVAVFKTNVGWILVCETSLRLHTSAEEVHRIELPEVIDDATWDNSVLVVRYTQGGTIAVSESGDTLTVVT